MTVHKPRILLTTMAAAILIALSTAPADAAKFKLDQKGIDSAVAHGKANFDKDATAFRWDYLSNLPYGYPKVLMRTEHLAISDYVRRSEFQRKYGSQRAHKLNEARIKSAQSEVDGKLQFVVTLYGAEADFMKAYGFHLMANGKHLMPAYVDMPVTGENSGFKGRLAYMATVFVDFTTDGLSGNEKVTFIVDAPKGAGPSGARDTDYKLPFDLSKVK
ncbi:MAG: hypothetical protein CFH10_01561 [Alphaproteobacteria bacterium MarineAlpha4_Bin2]|nr:hypothetical protein [Magnetovibrio sp.]PPR60368.1 MAG: hypothetical protein CFH10_01561 [Alphaproteobacteria bacterium MarineAlpha4_Bin2]